MDFLLTPTQAPTQRYAYIGVPHDASTSLGNPGGRFGPQALREALKGVFSWRLQNGQLADIDAGVVNLSAVEVADYGDVALSYHSTEQTVEQTYHAVRGALAEGYTPLVVGGDHGITFPPVKALHDTVGGRIGLIQLDAHCDLMDFSDRQGRFSGSSGMRRALELDRYQIGRELGVQRISATRFVEMGAQHAAEQALEWARNGTEAIYLTIDMDVINPGEAPGTGWPEPGGLTGQQVLDFVRAVATRVAAIDIAELNPVYDSPARTTALLAARILLDFITTRVRMG
jgi:agmatinase